MIKDISTFAWRIGLVLIIAMPLMYVAQVLAGYFVRDAQNPVVQALNIVLMVAPSIFVAIGIGCVICLLVRIEMHLRPRTKDKI